MPKFVHDEVEVLTGTHGALRWEVVASGTSDDLMTMLQVFDGDVLVASSGFGGPALYPGDRVNEWRGRTDDLPYFVMARTAAEVTRLVAVTDRGTRVEFLLGQLDARFGLRFAAAGMPDGEEPGTCWSRSTGDPNRRSRNPCRLCTADSHLHARSRPRPDLAQWLSPSPARHFITLIRPRTSGTTAPATKSPSGAIGAVGGSNRRDCWVPTVPR